MIPGNTASSLQLSPPRASLSLARGGETLAEIEVRVDEPGWLSSTMRQLTELLDLPVNWDSYGGLPIDRATVVRVLQLLGIVMQPATPPPTVIPTAQGGIELEWHAREMDLEVRPLWPSGCYAYCEDRRSGEQWEAELGGDISRLEQTLAEFTRRA